MNKEKYPKLHLPDWFDDICEFETPMRGFLDGAVVEMENGIRYQVYFVTPERIIWELNKLVKFGKPFYTEIGLVVLPEVTVEKVREAIKFLDAEDFFQTLKPLE